MDKIIYNYISKHKDVSIFEIYDLFRCIEYEDTDRVDDTLHDLIDKELIESYGYFSVLFFKIKENWYEKII